MQLKGFILFCSILSCQSAQTKKDENPMEIPKSNSAAPAAEDSWKTSAQDEIFEMAKSEMESEPGDAYVKLKHVVNLNRNSAHGKAAQKLLSELEAYVKNRIAESRKASKLFQGKGRVLVTPKFFLALIDSLEGAKSYCFTVKQKCLSELDKEKARVAVIQQRMFGPILVAACAFKPDGIYLNVDTSGTKKIPDAIEFYIFYLDGEETTFSAYKRYGPFEGLKVSREGEVDEYISSALPIISTEGFSVTFVEAEKGFRGKVSCDSRINYVHFTDGTDWHF